MDAVLGRDDVKHSEPVATFGLDQWLCFTESSVCVREGGWIAVNVTQRRTTSCPTSTPPAFPAS